MAERRSGLVLCWYLHLPTVCDDAEVVDLARRSIDPILRAHANAGQPVVLAITGTLLGRLAELTPQTTERLRVLVEAGLCEGAATCFHEVYPPVIPLRYLVRHLELDVALKEDLLGVRPATFFPPNFVWVEAFERILPDLGIGTTILDGSHYRSAVSPQTWTWSAHRIERMGSAMLGPQVDRREARRVVTYRTDSWPQAEGVGGRLRCLFRDNDLVARFSFGNTGLIHLDGAGEALDALVAEVRRAVDSGCTVTLADDGDRVNPLSLYQYEAFLARIGDGTVAPAGSMAPSGDYPDLACLPAFAIDGFDEFLRGGVDSGHYLALLAELTGRRAMEEAVDVEVLDLQDVFVLFWKTVARRRVYFDRVLDAVEKAGLKKPNTW
jgi:hypothetical protein